MKSAVLKNSTVYNGISAIRIVALYLIYIIAMKLRHVLNIDHFLDLHPGFRVVDTDDQLCEFVMRSEAQKAAVLLDLGGNELHARVEVRMVVCILGEHFDVIFLVSEESQIIS